MLEAKKGRTIIAQTAKAESGWSWGVVFMIYVIIMMEKKSSKATQLNLILNPLLHDKQKREGWRMM